jgi:hypothetical protein
MCGSVEKSLGSKLKRRGSLQITDSYLYPRILTSTDAGWHRVAKDVRNKAQLGFGPNVITRQLALLDMNQNLEASQREVLSGVEHWSADRIPSTACDHRAPIVVRRPPGSVHPIDCHAGLGEDAVIDSDQHFEDTALLRSVAALHELFGRAAVKDVARGVHPATSFDLVAEDLESAIPDRVGIRMLEFFGQLLNRFR